MDANEASLALIAPIRPGRRFAERFILEEAGTLDGPAFFFSEAESGARFAVRLIVGGPTDFTLDLRHQGPPSRDIDTLVRALSRLIERNRPALAPELWLALGRRRDDSRLGRLLAIPAERQLDIPLGTVCNSQCVFCTDRRPETALPRPLVPLDSWRREFERARAQGIESVTFVSFEPTLRRDLPELIRAARQTGIAVVQLNTNGVRLANRAYLEELVEAGLGVVILSVHAAAAELEDRLTGRPGMFAKKCAALENIRQLLGGRAEQEARGVFWRSNSVLTALSMHAARDLVEFLLPYEPFEIPLYFPFIQGRAEERFDELVPDYTAFTAAIEPLAPFLLAPERLVKLVNLPLCVATAYSPGVTPTKFYSSATMQNPGERRTCLEQMDATRFQPPYCDACLRRAECRGIARRYFERYGTLGLRRFEA